jgi:hypothetical protein
VYWTRYQPNTAQPSRIARNFPPPRAPRLFFAVDLGGTLCLGSLHMSSLQHHRHQHHHHTAIVSAEARGTF